MQYFLIYRKVSDVNNNDEPSIQDTNSNFQCTQEVLYYRSQYPIMGTVLRRFHTALIVASRQVHAFPYQSYKKCRLPGKMRESVKEMILF